MWNFDKILASLAVCATLLLPMQAFALSPFLSFGGRLVTPPVPCLSPLGPAVWITVLPFGIPGTIPLNFIVTIPSLGSIIPPIPSLPPTHALQQILGTYAPVPSACASIFGGLPLPGFQVVTENTSLVL